MSWKEGEGFEPSRGQGPLAAFETAAFEPHAEAQAIFRVGASDRIAPQERERVG